MNYKQLTIFMSNLAIFITIITIISFLCMFSWNFGVLYLLPNLGTIGFFNALAIVVVIALGHVVVNFYINKFFFIKNKKAEISQGYFIINMLNIIDEKLDEINDKKNS